MLTLALLAGYVFSMWFITEVGGYLRQMATNGGRLAANQVAQGLASVLDDSRKTAGNLSRA